MLLQVLIAAIAMPIGLAIIAAVYKAKPSLWDRFAPNGCGMVVAAIAVYIAFCFLIWLIIRIGDQF